LKKQGYGKRGFSLILLIAMALTFVMGGIAFADEDAIKKATVSFKETAVSALAVIVLVVGIIELTRRQIGAAISLILAAVLIYAATNTNLLEVIGTTVAGWFGATKIK